MNEKYTIEKINEDLENDFNRIQNILLNFNEDIQRKKYYNEQQLINSARWFIFLLNKCIANYQRNIYAVKKNNFNIPHLSLPELNYLLVQN